MSRQYIAVTKSVLALQEGESVEDVVDVVGVFGVPGSAVCVALPGVVWVRGEAVVQSGQPGDGVRDGGRKKDRLCLGKGRGGDQGVPPCAAVDVAAFRLGWRTTKRQV